MEDKEISKSLEVLKQGGTFAYPTDTVWGLGCDATNAKAVEAIYKIKNRAESKSLIILVNSFEMLKKYLKSVPENVKRFIENTDKPTTVIYNEPVGLANNVIANDNTVAIRIVNNAFCSKLIGQFEKPIVSTSANTSGHPTPSSFSEIEPAILESVDYVVHLDRDKVNTKSSTIIKINEGGEIVVLRP